MKITPKEMIIFVYSTDFIKTLSKNSLVDVNFFIYLFTIKTAKKEIFRKVSLNDDNLKSNNSADLFIFVDSTDLGGTMSSSNLSRKILRSRAIYLFFVFQFKIVEKTILENVYLNDVNAKTNDVLDLVFTFIDSTDFYVAAQRVSYL